MIKVNNFDLDNTIDILLYKYKSSVDVCLSNIKRTLSCQLLNYNIFRVQQQFNNNFYLFYNNIWQCDSTEILEKEKLFYNKIKEFDKYIQSNLDEITYNIVLKDLNTIKTKTETFIKKLTVYL